MPRVRVALMCCPQPIRTTARRSVRQIAPKKKPAGWGAHIRVPNPAIGRRSSALTPCELTNDARTAKSPSTHRLRVESQRGPIAEPCRHRVHIRRPGTSLLFSKPDTSCAHCTPPQEMLAALLKTFPQRMPTHAEPWILSRSQENFSSPSQDRSSSSLSLALSPPPKSPFLTRSFQREIAGKPSKARHSSPALNTFATDVEVLGGEPLW
jgi:hypothetical protein